MASTFEVTVKAAGLPNENSEDTLNRLKATSIATNEKPLGFSRLNSCLELTGRIGADCDWTPVLVGPGTVQPEFFVFVGNCFLDFSGNFDQTKW